MSPVPSSTAPAPSAPADSRTGGTHVNSSPEVFPESNIPPLLFDNFSLATQQEVPNPSLRRVIAFIDQNYMQRLTLDLVASHVYLHKTYICQLFTKHLQISFVTYLENVRINKAKELLHTTNMSIREIADAAGYANASYFSKVFKKRVGLTPQQYRAMQHSAITSPPFEITNQASLKKHL